MASIPEDDGNSLDVHSGGGKLSRLKKYAIVYPLVTLLILTGGVVYGWKVISDEHYDHVISDTRGNVDYIASRLEAHVSSRLVLAELIRQEWSDSYNHNKSAFQDIVNPKLKRFPDIQAINWTAENGIIRWVNPERGNEAAIGFNVRSNEIPRSAFDAALKSDEIAVTPPLDLVQGKKGFVAYIPFKQQNREPGVIGVVFRIEPLLEYAFPNDGNLDFIITISDDGIAVLEDDSETLDPSVSVSQQIRIAERHWTVTGTPSARYYAKSDVYLADFFLVVGMLIVLSISYMLRLLMLRHVAVRESEQRLADFADISSDWFWETDDQLRFSYFSKRFEDVAHVKPELLLGKTREEVGAPGSDPTEYANLLETMKNRKPFRNFEHYREKPDGEIAYLSISGIPTFDDDGSFAGYRGVGQNITERRLNQIALNEALMLSEKANKAKSQFLATMSHEFRTPLNAILGFSEMLREQYFGPIGDQKYLGYSNDIHRSGQHLLELVNDILDISAIEASKRNILKEDVSLFEQINEALKSVETDAQLAGLTMSVQVPSTLPKVRADKRSVLQIFINLLANAVKFSKPNGTITITALVSDTTISIAVADTGVGIDEEVLPQVLEPFTQAQTNPHLAEIGSGLGLTIVKALMDAHGGTMQIESVPNVGTTVTLVFIR